MLLLNGRNENFGSFFLNHQCNVQILHAFAFRKYFNLIVNEVFDQCKESDFLMFY